MIIIKREKTTLPPSLHYLQKVIGTRCHLLIFFCSLIVAVLLTSNSMFLVLYIIAFKYRIEFQELIQQQKSDVFRTF